MVQLLVTRRGQYDCTCKLSGVYIIRTTGIICAALMVSTSARHAAGRVAAGLRIGIGGAWAWGAVLSVLVSLR